MMSGILHLWLDTFPKSKRRHYPRWRGDAETDVVVIGGGLTGCACAYSIARAGMPVVLLEADRIGAGGHRGIARDSCGRTSTHRSRPRSATTACAARRTLWQGAAPGLARFRGGPATPAASAAISPPPTARGLPRVAVTAVRQLRREYDARREAGLDSRGPLPQRRRARDGARRRAARCKTRGFALDPFRACLGLAAAAVGRGRRRSSSTAPVTRVRDRRKAVEVADRDRDAARRERHRRDGGAVARPSRAAAPPRGRCTATPS